jgi:Tfp pilus assembly protein PilO
MVTQVKERNTKIATPPRRRATLPFGLKAHELVAAVAVVIFLILTVIFYFWTLKPKQEELANLQKQFDTLKKTEIEALKSVQQGTTPQVEDRGKVVLESLSYFKSAHLRPLSPGRIALINDINAMAKKNNVALTSSIDMQMDKAAAQATGDTKVTARRSKIDFLRVFPNLEMHFTVAGDYKNLRQFISDLEANKQFKTINSVNLQAVKDSEGPRGRRTVVLSGIALTIDMTAYFYPESN